MIEKILPIQADLGFFVSIDFIRSALDGKESTSKISNIDILHGIYGHDLNEKFTLKHAGQKVGLSFQALYERRNYIMNFLREKIQEINNGLV